MPSEATDFARQLFSFFKSGELNDARAFAAGVSAILARYPREVVAKVCHPTGLPSSLKFLPTIAEVRSACDAAMAPILDQMAYDQRMAEAARLRLEPPRENRPTLEQLKARLGADWGIKGEKAFVDDDRFLAPDALKQKHEEKLKAMADEPPPDVRLSPALRRKLAGRGIEPEAPQYFDRDPRQPAE